VQKGAIMTEPKHVTVTATNPDHDLRSFWRSNKTNKKKLEDWVDHKTHFGSVPVFLRSGSSELFEKALSDIQNP
jgi:hypothetical protein